MLSLISVRLQIVLQEFGPPQLHNSYFSIATLHRILEKLLLSSIVAHAKISNIYSLDVPRSSVLSLDIFPSSQSRNSLIKAKKCFMGYQPIVSRYSFLVFPVISFSYFRELLFESERELNNCQEGLKVLF